MRQLREGIESRDHQLRTILDSHELKYEEYFLYLQKSFEYIISQLEEKHTELNTALIANMQKQKEAVSSTREVMGEVKQSIERYVYDINKNYDGILRDLSVDSFRDIMAQYNRKIEYYQDTVLRKLGGQHDISIYLPLHEIDKLINKAMVGYYAGDLTGRSSHYEEGK